MLHVCYYYIYHRLVAPHAGFHTPVPWSLGVPVSTLPSPIYWDPSDALLRLVYMMSSQRYGRWAVAGKEDLFCNTVFHRKRCSHIHWIGSTSKTPFTIYTATKI